MKRSVGTPRQCNCIPHSHKENNPGMRNGCIFPSPSSTICVVVVAAAVAAAVVVVPLILPAAATA